MRASISAVLVGLAAVAAAHAQTGPLRFRWRQGQVLSYRTDHRTAVAEVVGGSKVATSSRTTLLKRWQVLAVDAQGVATLQMSLAAMRTEQTRPDGEVLLYDSADPDKSTPALREQMGKFLNQPLAVLRVDSAGRVIEVVKGPGGDFESDLPFVVTLPAGAVSAGQSWERPFKVVLAPPQGTGEEYQAVQKVVCTKADAASAVLAVTTAFKALPQSGLDQVPLLQKQADGEVVFDVQAGRLQSARLVIDKELHDHQGTGSNYRLQSTFTEQYVGDR
jgi:hypothetical protein